MHALSNEIKHMASIVASAGHLRHGDAEQLSPCIAGAGSFVDILTQHLRGDASRISMVD